MGKLLITVTISILIISHCNGYDITGGPTESITGNSTSASFDQNTPSQPIIDYSDIDPRDPSGYSSPPINKTISPTNSDTNDDKEEDIYSALGIPSHPLVFEINGYVNGTGGFSNRYSVDYIMGLNAKKTSRAITGDLEASNRFYIIGEMATYELKNENKGDSSLETFDVDVPSVIISQDNLYFVGSSYKENNKYINNGDYIQDKLMSGTIKKDSTYVGLLEGFLRYTNVTASETTTQTFYNKSTLYALDTRYVGIGRFNAKFTSMNCSEIFEDYTGMIAINRKLEYGEEFYVPEETENWLYCCLPA